MSTRTPDAQPDGDEPADRPVIVALDSDGGLDAFAPETESGAVSFWPPAGRAAKDAADRSSVEEGSESERLSDEPGSGRLRAEGASASLAEARAEAGAEPRPVWTDEDFVVRFPDGEPVSEDHILPPTAPPPRPEPAPMAPAASRPDRTRHLLMGLGVLVLLQAIPTMLWLQARVSPSAAAATGEADPAAEAAPAPVEVAAATTGRSVRDDVVLDAPPPAPAPVRREERRGAKPAPAPPSTPSAPPVIAAGLLSVDAPVPMQVVGREGVVGTTEAATIMLPPGTHDLEFRNDAVGYRERQTVTLQPGRTTRIRLSAPSGRLHANALPWAEVWIDNARAGQTPIGNLEVPVGTHEIVFRHPELGERRATVLVTLKEPARVSVDLRQP